MERRGLIFFTGLILLAITVRADIYFPILYELYFYSAFVLFIPIFIVEWLIFRALLKRFYENFKWYAPLLVILAANIVSSLVGLALTELIRIPRAYDSLFLIIPACILTIIVEFPVLYWYLRNKIEVPAKLAILSSLLINIISYLIIYLLLLFRWNIIRILN